MAIGSTRFPHLLNVFTRVKGTLKISGPEARELCRGFTSVRRDVQPEYISAARVKQVLRYEDLIPVIEKSFVNFSDRESGGVIQPVRLQVPVKKHSG